MKSNKKLIGISWLIILFIAVITGLFVTSIKSNTRMEGSIDAYMPKKHSAFVYSNVAEDLFGIKDSIIVAIENKDGIYNEGTLQKLKDITKDLQAIDVIGDSGVTSLYTADNIIGSEYGMEVNTFYKRVPNTPEQLQELKESVRANDMVYGRLVSLDEDITVIIAEINNDDTFTDEIYRKILAIGDNHEVPETIYIAGGPIVEGTFSRLAPATMKKMLPLVVLIIFFVLLVILRSLKGAVLSLLVVLLSTIWTFGLMSSLDIPIYSVTTMIPVMLIAIGVADGIHLFSHLQLYMHKNSDTEKLAGITNMVKSMWKPVVMTSITTAVGFTALVTSQIYPIKYFGLFTAFGVMCALLLSLVLIPAGLMIVGLPKLGKIKTKKVSDRNFAFRVADSIPKKKGMIILVTAFVISISLFGISRVWIDTSFLSNFEDDSIIVKTDKFINDNFAGTSNISVVLESDKNDAFKNPETLRLVYDLQSNLKKLENIGDTFSLVDFVRRMNKVMNEDREEFNTIPDSTDMIAQYLLLYEMSGDPDDLISVVDYNYKTLNLTAQVKSDNSKPIINAISVIERYRPSFSDLGIDINFAGSGYKRFILTNLILEGQILSIVLSIFIVIILISYMFKNIYIGLIASLPILITTLANFGTMGLLNIPLGPTTALISSIAIGIGIDYAIHFIDRYREYSKETRDKIKTARLTMDNTGRAIVFNAVVVIAGFLVLLSSVFPPSRQLGALVSLNMFSSFLGTLTIMFLLLHLSNIYFKNGKKVFKGGK